MNITIGTILAFIVGLSTFIGAITAIGAFIGKIYKKQVEKIVDPIYKILTEIKLDQCKDYLVEFLARKERGEKIDTEEEQRAFERYDLYTSLGGNSYIHNKWVKSMEKEG